MKLLDAACQEFRWGWSGNQRRSRDHRNILGRVPIIPGDFSLQPQTGEKSGQLTDVAG